MGKAKTILAGLATIAALTFASASAEAAQCGNNATGFSNWVEEFKQEAAGQGVSPAVLNKAFANVQYNKGTIRADRGQKSLSCPSSSSCRSAAAAPSFPAAVA